MALKISIHAAQEGCDRHCKKHKRVGVNFNPRSPRGLRLATSVIGSPCDNFNPRSPRGLRPIIDRVAGFFDMISIHAAQEGCDASVPGNTHNGLISIHAAQEGCDIRCGGTVVSSPIISIHAAQEGCDQSNDGYQFTANEFQSTQPKRAATIHRYLEWMSDNISIHAAQEGCDTE